MRKIKNIIVLAGGKSNRFWPLEEKNSVQMFGSPLIAYQLVRLMEFTSNLYINANSNNFEELKAIAQSVDYGIKVVKQVGDGQAAAILSFAKIVTGETLIVNANDFFDEEPIQDILNKLNEGKTDAILTAIEREDYFPGGYLKVDRDKVVEVVEKPGDKNKPSNLLRVVLDYFTSIEDFQKILKDTKSDKDDVYEKALTKFINGGKNISYVVHKGSVNFLKYPWHLLSLMNVFLSFLTQSHIDETSVIPSDAKIVGNVHIGAHVKVGNFVKIVGPCYIGDNTIIGDYALIRNSHIDENCLIGSSTEVARSYIGKGSMLHRDYVGDSVLAQNVLIGSGTTTANFRFDSEQITSLVKQEQINTGMTKFGAIIGADSKIGVNSTILPGIKIGKNTIVGPGEQVREDIDNDIFFSNGKKKENRSK